MPIDPIACFECGSPARHNHHVIPRSLGGTKTVPLCERCHGVVHGLCLENHGEIIKAALAVKKDRGELTGQAPFGFQLSSDGIHLQPHDGEQTTIKRARDLRASGLSFRRIEAQLASEGYTGRAGQALKLPTVHQIAKDA